MRLLNAESHTVQIFIQQIPPYVILSHTWGDGEVTFDDIHQEHASNMLGYSKIIKCCEQAIRDGYEWIWIDTCCIDKRSSSELSEAINSMYTWYWDAEICYAFLTDFTLDRIRVTTYSQEPPRWFSRGWCLQELLAPAVVEFYNVEWVCVGTKSSAVTEISALTGIDKKYLLDRDSIQQASIATRFSWASRRATTRPEDIAYCLLGLLDVNMPLLYCEGDNAFYRLQLELIRASNEYTIFAWDPQDLPTSHWQGHDRLGMLASHPCAFRNSSGINVRDRRDESTFQMTNSGLQINIGIRTTFERVLGRLNCQNASGQVVCIVLESRSVNPDVEDRYFRLRDRPLQLLPPDDHWWVFTTILVPGRVAPLAWRASGLPRVRRMRVNLPSMFPDHFELKKIELAPEMVSEFHLRTVEAHNGHKVIHLPYDTSGGFLFSDDESTFLIALGLHDKTMWSAFIPDVHLPFSSKTLGEISRKVKQSQELWKYLGDHHVFDLPNQASTKVVVHAKKKTVQRPLPHTSINKPWTIWDTTITFYSIASAALLTEPSLQSAKRRRLE